MTQTKNMKLYTTIENEKGKTRKLGGNEYLDIDIMVGNKYVGRFTLRQTSDRVPDGKSWALFDDTDGNDEPLHWIPTTKAKKQKAKKYVKNCDLCYKGNCPHSCHSKNHI
jgi:hypothetical protein